MIHFLRREWITTVVVACSSVLWLATPSGAQAQDGKMKSGDSLRGLSKSSEASTVQSGTCNNGFAGNFPCLNVDLRALVTIGTLGSGRSVRLNDVWGWIDSQTGRRFALVGLTDGTAFVEITDADSPVYRGYLPMTSFAQAAIWRDIKVRGHYAFVVADGSGLHGMQVFDLNDLLVDSSSPVVYFEAAHYSDIGSAHNIVIDEDIPFAFITGGSSGTTCSGGLHMVDISNPLQPSFSGCFTDIRTRRGYSHDAQCVIYHGPDLSFTSHQICIASNENAISIVDVTDKQIPLRLGMGTYPGAGYVHQGWLTEDHAYFVQDDELDESIFGGKTRTMIWDISDLDDPELVTEYVGDLASTDHNQYVQGNFSYQANYTSGLRILDIADIRNPQVVGYFDTFPAHDKAGFSGAWTAYPFFGDGLVLVSSRDEGLFVLQTNTLSITAVEGFTSTLDGDARSVHFSWRTISERDNAGFDIEEQDLRGDFSQIAFVPGSGTTSEAQSYEFDLSGVAPGHHVYRLSFGPGQGVQWHSASIDVFVVPGTHVLDGPWPNPVARKAAMNILVKENQHVSVDIYDVAGQRVLRLLDRFMTSTEEVRLDIDSSTMSGGLYFVRIRGDKFSETRELVVVH